MTNLEDLSYEKQLEARLNALDNEDFMRFGKACDITGIFPQDSKEHNLYQMYQAESEYQKRNSSKQEKITIPTRPEIPITWEGKIQWVRNLYELNNWPLPKHFDRIRGEKPVTRLYNWARKRFRVSDSDILYKGNY